MNYFFHKKKLEMPVKILTFSFSNRICIEDQIRFIVRRKGLVSGKKYTFFDYFSDVFVSQYFSLHKWIWIRSGQFDTCGSMVEFQNTT